MDVYSYFDKLRALKESTTSERAAELGYEYRSRGVWLDPKNGKRYKAKGTQFVELKPQETGERGPGKAQPDEIAGSQLKDAEQAAAEPQQTFNNFTSQMARVVPGGPTEFNLQQGDVEASAKQLARGRWGVLDDKQKKKYKQQAEFEIKRAEEERKAAEEAQAAADAEAEMMAQEQEPEGLDDLLGDIQGKKRPEEFPQLKDVAKEKVPEKPKEEKPQDIDDPEDPMVKIERQFQSDLEKLTERQRKAQEKKFGNLREALGKIPSDVSRDTFLKSIAHATTYEGRINAGAGKNNLGYVDIQNLVANRDRLLEGYGDGSPETIEKFVRSVRDTEVPDEFVDASFEILPDAFKKSLTGKGKVTGDKYVSDDKAHKDIHYIGTDEDGNVMRGAASSKERAKLMWRIYLEQGGRDAYTGLPLDIQAMDLEHVRGFNNKDGGKPGKIEWEQRENDKNFTLINSNINQKKVDLSMADFFAKEVDPNANKSEEDFGGVQAMFDKANEITDVAGQLIKTMVGDGKGKVKGLSNEMTSDMLNEYFNQDDEKYTTLRDEFRRVATDPKDKSKANGLKSTMGKQLLSAIGLTKRITDPSGRRTIALQENVYRGFLTSMANATPEDRQRYMDGWVEAIAMGNAERSPKGVTRTLRELGLIDESILNDKKLGKVFKEDWEWEGETFASFRRYFM